jgi:hypothetical protein
MTSDTTELLRALDTVIQHLPHTVDDILRGQMPPDRQHEFADLLIDLGRLLHRDAATHDTAQTDTFDDFSVRDTSQENAPKVVTREEEQR